MHAHKLHLPHSSQVQLAVLRSADGRAEEHEAVFVIDALQSAPPFRAALASALRSLLVEQDAGILPVGFAFGADAKKVASWLVCPSHE